MNENSSFRRTHPEVFWGKGILKMCSKDHPCRRVISLKLESNFIEITLLHEFSPVNLLHICCKDFLTNVIILQYPKLKIFQESLRIRHFLIVLLSGRSWIWYRQSVYQKIRQVCLTIHVWPFRKHQAFKINAFMTEAVII